MSETQSRPPGRPGPGIHQVVDYIDQRMPFPIGSVLLALISTGYLTNPTGGLIELIPDITPFIGNLDEAAATGLLIWSVGNMARWWRIGRAQRRARKEQKEEL